LLICLGCLGGCAGSSGNNGSFAPTPAAEHSAALAQAADKFTSVATPGNSAYQIGPLDVLDVQVFQVPDLTRSVQVADTGTINYPLVGEVRAEGKTAHQLELDLTKRLGAKYLQSPQVTVFIKEYNSQRVTVEGSVKKTGIYPLKGKTTLTQALAVAGDVENEVASGDVVIFRTINGKRSAARFDIDSIKTGKSEDPDLVPNDVIVVDTSATKVALQSFLKVLPIAGTAAMFAPL
jgi:polysaccharide biosynthesis/export protein